MNDWVDVSVYIKKKLEEAYRNGFLDGIEHVLKEKTGDKISREILADIVGMSKEETHDVAMKIIFGGGKND